MQGRAVQEDITSVCSSRKVQSWHRMFARSPSSRSWNMLVLQSASLAEHQAIVIQLNVYR